VQRAAQSGFVRGPDDRAAFVEFDHAQQLDGLVAVDVQRERARCRDWRHRKARIDLGRNARNLQRHDSLEDPNRSARRGHADGRAKRAQALILAVYGGTGDHDPLYAIAAAGVDRLL